MKKAFFFLLTMGAFLSGKSYAQDIKNDTALQAPANFNISGVGRARSFFTSQVSQASSAHFMITQNGSYRWGIGNAVPETTTDLEGNNFAIYAYNNVGTYAAQPLTITRKDGFFGFYNAVPTARLHVTVQQGIPFAKFTQSYISESEGMLSIINGTSKPDRFMPVIIGRSHTGSSTFGLYLVGESTDTTGPENFSAAIVLDGRSKELSRLKEANVMSVNSGGQPLMTVKANGNVGIGTTTPGTSKLAVEGTIAARRVRVLSSNPWPDYVFHQEYELASIDSVAAYIKVHQRLPGMPAAAEVEKEGVDLGEVNRKLVEKVEEMMLYIIKMEKRIQELEKQQK